MATLGPDVMSTLIYEEILKAIAKLPPRPLLKNPVTPPALIVCHFNHFDEVWKVYTTEGIEVKGTWYIDPDIIYVIDLSEVPDDMRGLR